MDNKLGKQRLSNFAQLALVAMFLIVVVRWVAIEWSKAIAAADHSAHAALIHEICEKLAAVPQGQPYPDSLKGLRLTYPDGGDPSLLDRFEYRSTGESCTVETVIGGKKLIQSFPASAEDGFRKAKFPPL